MKALFFVFCALCLRLNECEEHPGKESTDEIFGLVIKDNYTDLNKYYSMWDSNKSFDNMALKNIDIKFSYKEARVARRKLEQVIKLYPTLKLAFKLSEQDILLPFDGQNEVQKFQVKCPVCSKSFRNSFYLRLHLTRKHLIPEKFKAENSDIFWISSICEFVACDTNKRNKHEINEEGFEKHRKCLNFARRYITNWREEPETVSNFCVELVYAHKRSDPYPEHVSIMRSILYYFSIILFVVGALAFYYFFISIYFESKYTSKIDKSK